MLHLVHMAVVRSAIACSRVATWCLLAMMAITVTDIVMRWAFNEPVFGNVELVEWTLVALIFLAIPDTFLRGEHITVDLVDQVAPPRVVGALRLLAALVTLAFLGGMAWQMIPPALDTLEFGDATMDLRIPLIYYWAPLILGAFGAVIALLVVFVRECAAFRGRH